MLWLGTNLKRGILLFLPVTTRDKTRQMRVSTWCKKIKQLNKEREGRVILNVVILCVLLCACTSGDCSIK